jgi:hypothetical protein
LLSVWIGLFRFTEIRTTAGIAAGLIEVAAFAALALAAVADPVPEAARPASAGNRLLVGVQAAGPGVVAAVGAVSVLAVTLLGVPVAGAGGPPPTAAQASVTVKTARIGGLAVLTNANGRTLYWFAPDTPRMSKCARDCAAYWPPVTGTPMGGPGVTDRLGTITAGRALCRRPTTAIPCTPMSGDSGAGQVNGNNLNLNGGLWYEVRVVG